MPQDEELTQESRTEQVGVRVTAAEKKDVRFLAAALDSTESDIMRENRMDEIRARAADMRARLGLAAA